MHAIDALPTDDSEQRVFDTRSSIEPYKVHRPLQQMPQRMLLCCCWYNNSIERLGPQVFQYRWCTSCSSLLCQRIHHSSNGSTRPKLKRVKQQQQLVSLSQSMLMPHRCDLSRQVCVERRSLLRFCRVIRIAATYRLAANQGRGDNTPGQRWRHTAIVRSRIR